MELSNKVTPARMMDSPFFIASSSVAPLNLRTLDDGECRNHQDACQSVGFPA